MELWLEEGAAETSEWKGESVLTFLELSCNQQQVCLVGAGQFLFYSTSARLASREWPHGDSANFHGSWAIFSPSLAAEKCCKETTTYNSCLHPVLIFLSWKEGPGCLGSRGSRLERAVVGTGRRFIAWEGAVGRVAWSTGHGVRLEVQRPGLLSTWITRIKETADWGNAQFWVPDTLSSLDCRTLFLSTAIPLTRPVLTSGITWNMSLWMNHLCHWNTLIHPPLVFSQPSADRSESGSWGEILPAPLWSAWVRNRRLS